MSRITDTLTRSWAGMLESGRPMASMFFVGPRGSGKLTTARRIANFLYDDPERVIRISLDDFSDEARAQLLLGSGPDQEGLLTRCVREYPMAVIFLEDVERAHQKAMDGIHQLLERGHVFDGKGQRVEFRDSVIILSLSIDPDFFENGSPVGIRKTNRDNKSTQEQYERLLMPDLGRVLRADTLDLVDEVVFFPPLDNKDLTELLKRWTTELQRILSQKHNLSLSVDDSVYAYLIERGNEIGQGAGSLRRVFVREVRNFIANALLKGLISRSDQITLICQKDEIIYQKKEIDPPVLTTSPEDVEKD